LKELRLETLARLQGLAARRALRLALCTIGSEVKNLCRHRFSRFMTGNLRNSDANRASDASHHSRRSFAMRHIFRRSGYSPQGAPAS